jgi:hypothetical protein
MYQINTVTFSERYTGEGKGKVVPVIKYHVMKTYTVLN